ncbi:vitamin K epoxide reductase family protein, partial [Microbacterium sp. MTN4-26]
FGFVVWLIGQSIYVLGTLCPWCLVVWLTTLPLFFIVTARNLREGVFGQRARRVGAVLWPWITLVTVAAYLVVAVLAQLRLNVLASIV